MSLERQGYSLLLLCFLGLSFFPPTFAQYEVQCNAYAAQTYACCLYQDSPTYAPVQNSGLSFSCTATTCTPTYSWTWNPAYWTSCPSYYGFTCVGVAHLSAPCFARYFSISVIETDSSQSGQGTTLLSTSFNQISENALSYTDSSSFYQGGYVYWSICTWRTGVFSGYTQSTASVCTSNSPAICFPAQPPTTPSLNAPSQSAVTAVNKAVTFSWSTMSPDTAGQNCSVNANGPPGYWLIITNSQSAPTDPRPDKYKTFGWDTGSDSSWVPTTPGVYLWTVLVSNGALTNWSPFNTLYVCSVSTPVLSSVQGTDAFSVSSSVNFAWTSSSSTGCGSGTIVYNVVITASSISYHFQNSITGTTLAVPNLQSATYTWSVSACFSSVCSAAASGTFVRCLYVAPNAPALISPSNGASFYSNTVVINRNVTVHWNAPSSWGTTCTTTSTNRYLLELTGITTGNSTNVTLSSTAPTFYNFDYLLPDTYSWKVYDMNSLFSVSSATTWQFTVNTGCTVSSPSSPTLNSPTGGTLVQTANVTFSWSLSSIGNPCNLNLPTSFEIFYQTQGSSSWTSIIVPATQFSYVLSGLSGSFYNWYVTFTNAANLQSKSSATTFDYCPTNDVFTSAPSITAPTANQQFDIYSTSVATTFVWTPAVLSSCAKYSAISYDVYYGSGSLGSASTSGTNLTVTGLNPGSNEVTVKANAFYASEYSMTIHFSLCLIVAPTAPTLSSPSNGASLWTGIPPASGQRNVTLVWTEPSFGNTCSTTLKPTYLVAISNSSWAQNYTIAGATNVIDYFSNLAPSTYSWYIMASNGLLTGPSSVVWSFTISEGCTPTAPSNPALQAPTSAQLLQQSNVTLQWSLSSTGNPCGLTGKASFDITVTGPSSSTLSLSGSTYSTSLVGLAQGTYTWTVKYTNAAGLSATSPSHTFVMCPPSSVFTSGPTIQSPKNGSTTEVSSLPTTVLFSWSAAGTASCFNGSVTYTLTVSSSTGHYAYTTTVPSYYVQLSSATTYSVTLTASTTYGNPVQTISAPSSSSSTITACLLAAPSSTSLVSPANGAALWNGTAPANNIRNVTVTWTVPSSWGNTCTHATSDQYFIYLQVNGGPSMNHTITNPTQTSYNFPNLTVGTWSWSVYTQNSLYSTPASSWQFTVSAGCTKVAPSAPTLTSPTNTTTITATTATLAWSLSSEGNPCGSALTDYFEVTVISPTLTTTVYNVSASNTTLSLSGLVQGTYSWSVRYYNPAGDVSVSKVYEFIICPPSSMITLPPSITFPANNAAFDMMTVSSLTIKWAAPTLASCVTGSVSYTLVLTEQGTVNSFSTSSTSYSFSTLDAGNYTAQVTAAITYTSATASSSVIKFYRCVYAAPTAPTLVSPSDFATLWTGIPPANGQRNVTVTWGAASSFGSTCNLAMQSMYLIQIQGTLSAQKNYTVTNLSDLSYYFSSLAPDTYTWTVIAANSLLATPASSTWQFIVSQGCTPTAPSVPTLTSPSVGFLTQSTSMTFSWSLSSTGHSCGATNSDSFTLTVAPPSGSPIVTSVAGSVLSTTLNTLTAAGTYTWSVKYTNAAGLSNTSSTVTFIVCPPTDTFLSAPSNTAPTANQALETFALSTNVIFKWTAAKLSSCASSYQVLYVVNLTSTGGFTTFSTTGLSINMPNIAEGSYSFTVSAVAKGVYSVPSTATSFTRCLYVAPSAATLVSPTNGVSLWSGVPPATGQRNVTLSWSAPSSLGSTCSVPPNNHYSVNLNAQSASTNMTYNTTNLNTLTDFIPNLSPDTYTWNVYVVNALFSVPSSVTWQFVVDVGCTVTAPAAPILNSPTQNSYVQQSTVTLSWSLSSAGNPCGATNPDSFSIFLLASNGSVQTASVAGSVFSYSFSLAVFGDYTWNVTYTNAALLNSTSVSGTFIYCTPSQIFQPSISIPANNSVGIESQPLVLWTDSTPAITCTTPGAYIVNYVLSGVCVTDCLNSNLNFSISTNSLSSSIFLVGEPGVWALTVTATAGGLSLTSSPVLYRYCAPSTPAVPSLTFPPFLARGLNPNITFTWNHVIFEQNPACASFGTFFEYEVFVNTTQTFVDPVCVVNGTTSSLPPSCTWMAPGSGVYFWKLRAIRYIEIQVIGRRRSSFTLQEYYRDSSVDLIEVCMDVPPITPTLVYPINNTAVNYDNQNITIALTWNSLLYSQFGVVCPYTKSLFNPYLIIYFDTVNPPVKQLEILDYNAFSTEDIRSLQGNMKTNVTYYWQIAAANGLSTVYSSVQSFYLYSNKPVATVAPTVPSACVNPPCIPSQSNALSPGALAGIIVGVIFGSFVALLIIFFTRRRYSRKDDRLEKLDTMLELEPTRDDAVNAYVVPSHTRELIQPKYSLFGIKDKLIWTQFEELVVARDFKLPFLVLQAVEGTDDADLVTKSLVYLFQLHGYADDLIRFLISREIRKAEKENILEASTLFRANSFASAAFTAYCRVEGLEYLVATLRPFHVEIIRNYEKVKLENEKKATAAKRQSSKSTMITTAAERQQLFTSSFEMDPSRLDNEDDQLVNRLALELACQRLLHFILSSEPVFPVRLRHIMHHVRETITARFPTAAPAAIGGFIFLRLINPAIITPQSFGLLPQDPETNVKRQLVLLTKVLQNLANGTRFKESFMQTMNDFIEDNRARMEQFFREVSNKPTVPSPPPLPVPEHVHYYSLAALHSVLYRIRPKISKVLDEEVRLRPEQAHTIRSQFIAIMDEIGEPINLDPPQKEK